MNSEKKTFKEMIESHRSSRMSQNSSKLSSSFHQSIRRHKEKGETANIVYYEKKDSIPEQFSEPSMSQSQVLTEQVNEGYGVEPIKSIVRKNSKLKSKNPYESQPKVMTSNFSRKSLMRDKDQKSSSRLKLSRRSSRSGAGSNSVLSSDGDHLNRENKRRFNNANTDDYMIQPSKAPHKLKSNLFSQLSSKRPVSSHSKIKYQNPQPKVSQFEKQEPQRPQTSSNHQINKAEEANDHYQIRRTVNHEPDKINEPSIKPMENSYYGIEEI